MMGYSMRDYQVRRSGTAGDWLIPRAIAFAMLGVCSAAFRPSIRAKARTTNPNGAKARTTNPNGLKPALRTQTGLKPALRTQTQLPWLIPGPSTPLASSNSKNVTIL